MDNQLLLPADVSLNRTPATTLSKGGPKNVTRLLTATLALMLCLLSGVSFAQFTPGNLAVVVAAASASNTTGSVIEINTSSAGQSAITTTAIDGTNATTGMRFSGSATSTMYLATTNDGTLLSFTGATGNNTASNVNTLLPRTVGTLNGAATFNVAANYTGGNGNQTRGASSLNNSTWYIGDQGGFYTNSSSSTSPSGNIRSVKAFGGTMYAFTASATIKPVGIISAATGGTFTGLTGLTSGTANMQDFYLISSGSNGTAYDILYILATSSATVDTIYKFSLVSGVWTANGFANPGVGGFGFCAQKAGTGATLFLTTGTGATTANSVAAIPDAAGYNATISLGTKTTLYTSAAGTIIKGIAFTPSLSTLDNTGTPATGTLAQGATTKALFGFRITPQGKLTFNSVKVTFAAGAGNTATTSDISNLQLAVDNNNNGIYDAGDVIISSAGQSLASTITFSSLANAVSAAKRYLVIGDVSATATPNNTITGSVAVATDYTTNAAINTGTAAGNTQTIIAPLVASFNTSNLTNVTTLSTVTGTASSNASFDLNGVNLDQATAITITAPTNFEVSTDGTNFFPSITWNFGTAPYTSATLASTTISVRITSGSALGAVSGNVTVSGAGVVTPVTVGVSGTVFSAAPTVQANTITFANVTATGFDINWTNGNGANRIVVVRATSTTNVLPVDGTTYTASLAFGSVGNTTGAGNSVVYNNSGSGPITVTGLSGCTDYTVEVYEFNGSGGGENYLTSSASGNPNNQTTLPASIATVTGQNATANGVSGQVSVSWTNPAACFDDIMIVAKPTATPFTAATPTGNAFVSNSNSFTDGTNSTFDGGVVIYKGTSSPQVITNLTNGTSYTFKFYTRFGTQWSATGVTSATTPFATLTFTENILPKYIQGGLGTNNARVPYAYRATLGGLTANTTYNYYNQVVISADGISTPGAGNAVFPNAGNWVHSPGPGFTAGNFGTFTTDASGNYSGWFITEPTGNASRFATAGTQVFMRILVNDGASGTTIAGIGTSTNFATVMKLNTTSTATDATAIRSTSSGQPKDFVVIYDNTTGTGRALAATFIESDALAENAGNSYAAYYGTSVDGVAGAWGAIMPNANASGVQRIESRKYSDGSLLCFSTNGSGFTGTANPTGGTTEVVVTGVPLNCSVVAFDQTNIAQVGAGTIATSTNDNIVSNFHIGVSNGPSTLTSISFNIGGTFNAGDVTNFNLYTSTSNSFPGGAALSTVAAGGIANGGTITFGSLAQSLSIGDQYFWIAADLSATGSGKTIIAPALPNGDFTFAMAPTISSNTIVAGGTQTISTATPTITLASGTVAAGNIVQNTNNNVLYRADVTVSTVAAQLTDAQFTTGGAYAASDLTNLKLWYSASSTFNAGTATLLSTLTTSLGTVTHDFASLAQSFGIGTNYLFVTTDVACANVPDQINILGFAASDFNFASGTPTGSGSTSGTQTITEATPANVTGASALGSTSSATITWTNPGCFSDVMIVASSSAFSAAVPSGNAYTFHSSDFTDGSNSTFDGGVVVYKGTTSPEIIIGLTNGTLYNFKIYTRNGNTWSAGVTVSTTPSLTFNPGDIQICGMGASGTDNFAFVTWVPIPTGTVIKFTDNAFLATASANATNNFRGGEGQIAWTAPAGGLSIGQVVRITSNGSAGAQTATVGTATALNASFALNASGDQLFVFTGPDVPTANPSTFTGNLIYGVTWGPAAGTGGAWLTTGGATTALSYLPTEITSHSMAFSGQPNADYPNSLRNNQTTFSPYKALVMNPANFVGSSGAITVSSTNFTLFSPGLIISEIMYDSPGADEEWVELYNGSASTIDLFGYQLTNTTPSWTFTFPTHFNIVPGQYITVQVGTSGAFPFTPDVVAFATADNLSNTGSTVSILDATSTLVNTVTYNNTVLTAAAGNGASLEVTDVTQQNENFPTNWQTSAVQGGSPGSINSTGVSTIYSRGSGVASTAAIWSSTPTGGVVQTLASLGGFASNRNVVIQTGNTVQISSGFNVENLTVQTGAKLWRNSTLISALSYISVYGSTVQLDGTVGNGNTFDAIGMNIEGTTVTVQGNGTVNFARIRKSGNTNNTSNLVIDKNLGLTFVGTALYNNQGSAGTFNVTVNAGSTVDFKGTGHVSIDGTDGINNSTRYGTFTVNGTLTNVDTIFIVTDNNNAGTTKLDIPAGGVVNANTVMVATAVNAGVYAGGNTANMQFTVGGKLNVFKSLELQSGNFAPTGTVTLKSTTVNSIAILNNFSANFNGTFDNLNTGSQITAERFYASSLTYHQHEMGSPVSTPNLSQFGAASGTPGYVKNTACDETRSDLGTPYGTVFAYDETHGAACAIQQWNVLTSGTATNGVGYSVLKIGSGTLSLTGTPNLNTSYTVPVTNSGWSNFTLQGRAQLAGYALVSNPYPATITISGATQTANEAAGFDGTVLVWNANGPSAGSYTPATTIAPFQSFLVHKTSAGGTSTYTINASDRVTTATTFYKQVADNELNITATNNNSGLTDAVMVGFKSDATTGFDPQYDAHKVAGALDRHTLYTVDKDGLWMLNNVLTSIQETNAIPMNFEPGATGSYTFNFDGINTFDATSYITLEDKQTNTFHDVRSGAYTFTSDSADNWNRFVLHFTPAATINTTDATCTNQGMINVQQTGTANWNYTIANNNTVISTGTLNANSNINTSVTAGVYTLTLTDNNGYTVVKNVEVKGAQPVVANFTTPAIVQAQEEVNFTSNSQNATTNNWNFGDGSVATGNTTTHTYSTGGTYTITLVSTNDGGCEATATRTLNVTREITGVQNLDNGTIKIWSNENMVNVNFANTTGEAVVTIYNILGQQLVSDKLTNTSNLYTKAINNMGAGYVVVSVKNGTETSTKKVFIINNK